MLAGALGVVSIGVSFNYWYLEAFMACVLNAPDNYTSVEKIDIE